MLQQYIDGKVDPAFLKKLAIAAMQVGDKPGAELTGKAYIAGLKNPLSEEDIRFVSQFTNSTKDPGFAFMNENADQFKKVMGDRPYTVKMMNMIFHGEIEPVVNSSTDPDWNAIEAKIKPFGAAGEEILLRAETVALYNKQDWVHYVPVAKTYLEKYGEHISDQEKNAFQQEIDEHSGGNESNSTNVKDDEATTDQRIKTQIIDPAIAKATAAGNEPDWGALTKVVTEKYDSVYAGRTVTRARIFYYYSKDWPQFATAIVEYTEKYENKDDDKTMNTNANFVLKYSNDKKELQTALGWAKILLDKEPGNNEYKKTFQELQNKVRSIDK
jgi:hypothetical protein